MLAISPENLQDGDVLLYHGTALLSKLIMTFDGGNYSHAGIFHAGHITEALGDGIDQDPVASSVAQASFVDVYRFTKDGQGLGGAQYPVAPLDAAIATFEANKNAYAYQEILLLALLCATRRLNTVVANPALAMVVRNFLDHAGQALVDLTKSGKKPVICSEMVFRCYENAGTAAAYSLEIRGADVPAAAALDGLIGQMAPSDAAAAQQIRAQAAAFVANYRAASGDRASSPALETLAVADFVTPHDLENSPNLQIAGRLEA